MQQEANKLLKWLYCLALISSIFPPLLTGPFGWIAVFSGGGVMRSVGIIVITLSAIYLYRVVLVVRHENTLDAFITGKLVRSFRVLGIILMALGLIGTLTLFILKPILLDIFSKPGDSNVAYFVTGIYFYLISNVGFPGVMLFEASRLLGFEENLRDQNNRDE
jgi:hypothetical protein